MAEEMKQSHVLFIRVYPNHSEIQVLCPYCVNYNEYIFPKQDPSEKYKSHALSKNIDYYVLDFNMLSPRRCCRCCKLFTLGLTF